MVIRRQDRAALVVRTILRSVAEYVATDAALKEYLVSLLADEFYEIKQQIAAQREGDDA